MRSACPFLDASSWWKGAKNHKCRKVADKLREVADKLSEVADKLSEVADKSPKVDNLSN